MNEEIKYYDFKEGSSILDFSAEQISIPSLIGTTQNNLQFYLGHSMKAKYGRARTTEIPQSMFVKFKEKFNSKTQATFHIVEQRGDTLLLPNYSMDYVLCRNNLNLFGNYKTMVAEWHRVLKPKGQLYIKGNFGEKTELSTNSFTELKEVIIFFEKSHFKLISTNDVVHNKHMTKKTPGGKQVLLHVPTWAGLWNNSRIKKVAAPNLEQPLGKYINLLTLSPPSTFPPYP